MDELYVGLDISQQTTHLCAVDGRGEKVWQGNCPSTPEAIAKMIRTRAPSATRIGLETGSLSFWLWHALNEMGLPVACLDARHVAGHLKLRLNKTDKNDARGIAEYLQKGNCRIVNVKRLESQRIRTLMGARAQLVGMRTDLKNQIRGFLKSYGCILSDSEEKGFDAKLKATIKGQRELRKMIEPLMTVLASVHEQTVALDKVVEKYAEGDKICSHLMTIPGIGAITAVAFTTAIDDPHRFKKSRSVGAYFGLTSRRYQSGEVDYSGRISKCGDSLVRAYLYEAASSILTRTKSWSALKSWGLRIAKDRGMSKAKVAVARKLAVIMHQMWITGEAFRWSEAEAAVA